VLALANPASAEDSSTTGSIRGRLQLDLAGSLLADLHPIVVYLEPIGAETRHESSPEPVEMKQDEARFSPSFRAVPRGQTIEMPNGDAIFHNVFSSSHPNDFDLGTYAAGKSRSVTLDHAGVVKVYCSIHESMNATIFVSPSPWFTIVSRTGAYSITNVPPGQYTLKSWCEKLPEASRPVVVEPGVDLEVDIDLLKDAR
jgi:plastocyanin